MTSRRFSMVFVIFAVFTLIVGLSGCEKAMEMMPDDQMPGEQMPDQMPGITIGIAVAETGENAEPYGLPMKRGLELAKEELNMAGANIEFAYMDNMSTIDGAKEAVQVLVDKGVPAIIGVGISTHLKEAFPIAQEAGVVAFSPISSAAGLSGEIGDYVFRAGLATNVLMPGGVKKSLEIMNYETAAVIYDMADVYSTSVKDELEKALMANNVTVKLTESFSTDDTDFMMQLKAIMDMDPDVLYVSALSTEMVMIMKQAGELGVTAQLIVPDLTDTEVSQIGMAAEGALAFAGWSSKSDTPGNQEFVAAYMAKHDMAPEPWAAQAYATLKILANAIMQAQSTDSMAIRDALAMTMSLDTILGPFSFDPMGEAIYEEILVQKVIDGALQNQ